MIDETGTFTDEEMEAVFRHYNLIDRHEYCPKCKKWFNVVATYDRTNLCSSCNSELEEPFKMHPPLTEEDIKNLKQVHDGMFDICERCGSAGHMDELFEVNGKTVVYCHDCISLEAVPQPMKE